MMPALALITAAVLVTALPLTYLAGYATGRLDEIAADDGGEWLKAFHFGPES